MSCAKTAVPFEIQFWMLTQVGPRNHGVGSGSLPRGRGNLGEDILWPVGKYREYAA